MKNLPQQPNVLDLLDEYFDKFSAESFSKAFYYSYLEAIKSFDTEDGLGESELRHILSIYYETTLLMNKLEKIHIDSKLKYNTSSN